MQKNKKFWTFRKVLIDCAQTDKEYKDYVRYAAVLKWAKTCNGNVKNVSRMKDGEGMYIRVTFWFFDADSFIAFNKDFQVSVKGASI